MKFIGKILGNRKVTEPDQPLLKTPDPVVAYHLTEATRTFQQGYYGEALLHCEQVLTVESDNANAYRIRGISKYNLQDSTGAMEDVQHSLKLAREKANAL